jgi:HEAT repeat protein
MPPAAPKRRRVSGVLAAGVLAAGAVMLIVVAVGRALLLRRQPITVPTAAGPSGDWLTSERKLSPSAELKKLQARFESAPDDDRRHWTLVATSKQGEPAAVMWLARLAAQDPRVGRWAEDALAHVANPRSGLELGDIATSKGPPRVRAAAIRALGASGELPQAAQLSALVTTPTEPPLVRQAAATALGLMGQAMAVPALTSALQGSVGDTTHDGQELRVLIVQALARLGPAGARTAIEAHGKATLAPTERAVVDSALATPAR